MTDFTIDVISVTEPRVACRVSPCRAMPHYSRGAKESDVELWDGLANKHPVSNSASASPGTGAARSRKAQMST